LRGACLPLLPDVRIAGYGCDLALPKSRSGHPDASTAYYSMRGVAWCGV